MKDVLGIINNTKEEKRLDKLIKGRSLATIPFIGRYRLIDFYLSNMVNSGMANVGILVRKNYRSLIGHVRSPKEWDLDRKNDGIFILPGDSETQDCNNFKGDLEILQANMDYIIRSKQKYVLITSSNIISNIDYSEAIKSHKLNENDITLLYKDLKNEKDIEEYTKLEIDDENKVTDIYIYNNKSDSTKVSLESYIMKKSLFMKIINTCTTKGKFDLLKDGIKSNLNKYKISAYEFKGETFNINSVQSYYDNSMKLLENEIWNELFLNKNPIYTKMKDLAPVKYGKHADVENSLISNGCIIDGEVKNSIIFRAVKVKKGAVVENSIVMQNTIIESDSILKNIIVDKDCYISKGKQLKASERSPLVVGKKTII